MKKDDNKDDKTPQDQVTTPEERQELFEKIEKVRFAMVTTVSVDGALGSRPMTLQGIDGDGTMWFFTSANTQLGDDVNGNEHVNVAFADTGDDFYLSASGSAYFVDDRQKVEALWNVMAAAWFDGPTDPNLWLLSVKPDRIDYWKPGAGKMLQMVAMAKAALTNTRPGKAVGEHGSFEPRTDS